MTPVTSWVPGAADSGFDHDNLPYGVFLVGGSDARGSDARGSDARGSDVGGSAARVGVRVGSFVLDLTSLARADAVSWAGLLQADSLNRLMAAGPSVWAEVRAWAGTSVTDPGRRAAAGPNLHPLGGVVMQRPFEVADYVDFYANENHAAAVGRLFRPDAEPLPPNWKHLPLGYHGRAGTVVPSGTPVVRPCGQLKSPAAAAPTFGPTARLDIEAEVGFVVGVGSEQSFPVAGNAFTDHVFGVCLVNDWSARDIQVWEYIPLGPFLGKSFATSTSHWITPLSALQAARVPPPPRSHPLLGYLADDPAEPWGLALELTVTWNGTVVSRPPFASMYYTGPQLLAQLTANGASTRTGDLFASGTVSGARPDQAGSFLELSEGGRRRIRLADGAERTFLCDGDTVTITASTLSTGGGRLELGDVTGTIAPARAPDGP